MEMCRSGNSFLSPRLVAHNGSFVSLCLRICLLSTRLVGHIVVATLVRWGHDEYINSWNKPLQQMGIPVLPYLIDIDNATQMQLVYDNNTAFIADAVAVAEHYGFQGWFIDYEDEYPPDKSPNKVEKLRAFLNELGAALKAKHMQLTICVASWSGLISNYSALASTAVDELQLMSTYAESTPGDFEPTIDSYFSAVKKGDNGSLRKAGVGVGIYYDGHGYPQEWNATNARAIVEYVAKQGGKGIDVFRLADEGSEVWPREEFWWDVLSDFVTGKI